MWIIELQINGLSHANGSVIETSGASEPENLSQTHSVLLYMLHFNKFSYPT